MSTPPDTRVTCLLCPPRVRRRQIIRGGSQGLATHIRFVHSLRDYYRYIDRWGQRATRRLGDPRWTIEPEGYQPTLPNFTFPLPAFDGASPPPRSPAKNPGGGGLAA